MDMLIEKAREEGEKYFNHNPSKTYVLVHRPGGCFNPDFGGEKCDANNKGACCRMLRDTRELEEKREAMFKLVQSKVEGEGVGVVEMSGMPEYRKGTCW
jgi:hypothetical protein